MEEKSKVQKIEIAYIILLYLFVIQNIISNQIKILQYFDEIISAMLIPILLIYIIKNKNNLKIKKYDLIITIMLLVIFIIGIYSNLKFKYQSVPYALMDSIVVYKFFCAYFMISIVFKNKIGYSKYILNNIKILIITMFMGTILDYILSVNISTYVRYGFRANQFLYSHPTYLAASAIFLLVNYIRFAQGKKNIYIYMIILVICSTLRLKAIGFIGIAILIFKYIEKTNKKLNISKLALVGVIAIIIALQQIQNYFFINNDTARSMLLKESFEIANDYFPIGTGFGTYASYYSGVSYSKVYSLYNLDKVHGLSKEMNSFITDMFWPMLLGQFGYIGTMLYILCLYFIYKKIQIEYTAENKYAYISKILALIYLLIASTSETAFTNSYAVALALIIAI